VIKTFATQKRRAVIETIATPLLNEARSLQAAFPNFEAMQAITISPLPVVSDSLLRPLKILRDEMLLLRAGKTDTVLVLDDEIRNVESMELPSETICISPNGV
jgi:hypothetical protein